MYIPDQEWQLSLVHHFWPLGDLYRKFNKNSIFSIIYDYLLICWTVHLINGWRWQNLIVQSSFVTWSSRDCSARSHDFSPGSHDPVNGSCVIQWGVSVVNERENSAEWSVPSTTVTSLVRGSLAETNSLFSLPPILARWPIVYKWWPSSSKKYKIEIYGIHLIFWLIYLCVFLLPLCWDW